MTRDPNFERNIGSSPSTPDWSWSHASFWFEKQTTHSFAGLFRGNLFWLVDTVTRDEGLVAEINLGSNYRQKKLMTRVLMSYFTSNCGSRHQLHTLYEISDTDFNNAPFSRYITALQTSKRKWIFWPTNSIFVTWQKPDWYSSLNTVYQHSNVWKG